MDKQSWLNLPKTTLGKWSVGLVIAMGLLFFIGSSLADSLYESVPAGSTVFADIAARPALALTMLAGMAAGVAAFITGLVAIFKKKERAWLIYGASFIGAVLIFYLVAEILFPH